MFDRLRHAIIGTRLWCFVDRAHTVTALVHLTIGGTVHCIFTVFAAAISTNRIGTVPIHVAILWTGHGVFIIATASIAAAAHGWSRSAVLGAIHGVFATLAATIATWAFAVVGTGHDRLFSITNPITAYASAIAGT